MMNLKGKTVVVGMSGGVDSSVSALLLKQAGANVIGMFMKNWDDNKEESACRAQVDYDDVKKVCHKLEIPYYPIEFVQEYRDHVFNDFIENLKKGLTPNPDILCNREIKFKRFFEQAMNLGADYLATGHYCQNINGKLVKGRDGNKDQTYFLYTMKREVLDKVLFPIGNLEKFEVRRLAKEHDLITSDKKDSTGICFIGEKNFKKFISDYLPYQKGEFRQLDGTVVGEHYGCAFYTLGQRKGLGLGGPGEPWFVIQKDIKSNIVYVERGEHPALFAYELIAKELTLVNQDQELPESCHAKIRYRQKDQACHIEKRGEELLISFTNPQRAITPGQSVVFYKEDVCLGGAIIQKVQKYLSETTSSLDHDSQTHPFLNS